MMLTRIERETIINFNEEEKIASIFTYNRRWQQHLEKKLWLEPIMDNGCGGKEYELPKKMIKPPRAPRKLSPEAKIKAAEALKNARFSKNSLTPASKSTAKQPNKGKYTPRVKKVSRLAV